MPKVSWVSDHVKVSWRRFSFDALSALGAALLQVFPALGAVALVDAAVVDVTVAVVAVVVDVVVVVVHHGVGSGDTFDTRFSRRI